MRRFFIFLIAFQLAPFTAGSEERRPRVIVLTDITNEPDDQESLVRFLVYGNEYDVDGLIATTSTWLRNRTSTANIRKCVDAYGKVRANLARHVDGFPAQDALVKVIKEGLPVYGMKGVGEGKDSEGSKWIEQVVDREDARPVWVCAWGGPNCLAQALWKAKKERTPDELAKFVAKLRVYTISDQDDSGEWMRRTFPELFYVVSPSGQRSTEYHQATWTGISGDKYYLNGPGYRWDLIENKWLKENIRDNHGALGELYLPWKYIMEGDSPSFMHLINNGLGSHVSPGYGGWGGRYVHKRVAAGNGPIWTDSRDAVTTQDGRTHLSSQASVWRWREAYQHDFAARMDWCVKAPDDANHNPVAVVQGDRTKKVIRLKAKKGETVTLSAEGTSDPDGDQLTYHWFHYAEAETDLSNFRQQWSVKIEGAEKNKASMIMPDRLPHGVKRVHVILDVRDDGDPPMHAYRRVVIQVVD